NIMPRSRKNSTKTSDQERSSKDWGKLSIDNLRQKLRSQNLQTTGKKIELQNRLFNHFNPNPIQTTTEPISQANLSTLIQEFRTLRSDVETMKKHSKFSNINNNNINTTPSSFENPQQIINVAGEEIRAINTQKHKQQQSTNMIQQNVIEISNDETEQNEHDQQHDSPTFGFTSPPSSTHINQGSKVSRAGTIRRPLPHQTTIRRLGKVDIHTLTKKMHQLLSNSLAPRTNTQYHRCTSNYLLFCRHHNLQAFPIVELNLMLFTTFLSEHSSHSNIKVHLSSIKFHDIRHGYHTQLPPLPRLYLLIRSIKRTHGSTHSKPKRQPITIETLTSIYQHLQSSNLNNHDRQMLWTACTTAFFGFLRSSEYVSPSSHEYDPSSTLLYNDITHMASKVHISIKSSKTDPFRHGCILRLCPTNHPICPVTALKEYCRIHLKKSGPLFIFSNGCFLTRRKLNEFLQSTLNQPHHTLPNIHALLPNRGSNNSSRRRTSQLVDQTTW
uniref:SAP domain-containing protein n=1 Tax=Clytia hemisphaerica TaxID=252671 RepID=A0A7M5X165_9CNID